MRPRLLIGTVLLTIATITAFFVPAAIALSHAENDAQIVELQREAAEAAARVDLGPVGELGPTAGQGVRPSVTDEDHDFGVYDERGALRSGVGPASADEPVAAALAGRATSATLGAERIVALPLAGGGALRAAEPKTEAESRTRQVVARLALIALLVLLAATIGAWLLARRLTGPLVQLRQAAARLGGGDFTATAPRTGVAEIDDVADALNTSAVRIGDLVERERRLTADTSHQLRTPLAGLRLVLEGELASPRPDRHDVIVEALGAVDRLESTVTALTQLARDDLTAQPFDGADLVDVVVLRWTDDLAQAGRRLVVDHDLGHVMSTTREIAIETALDVLLDNALRHGRGVVTVHAHHGAGSVLIDVQDEGVCELTDPELFERHLSGHGGTGIGLHLARTLAEGEGARLRLIRSDPTTFRLQLPVSHELGTNGPGARRARGRRSGRPDAGSE